MIEFLKTWLPITSTFIGILITATSFLIPLIKSEKAKKVLKQINKSFETALKIAEAVRPYIEEAENFINYTGEEKKAYVMTKANQFAIQNKLPFDEKSVSDEIEKLVKLTKVVNMREKDRIA